MILLSLTGEQPIPNLMPLWQFSELDQTQFIATSATLAHAANLQAAILHCPTLRRMEVLPPVQVEAYDIQKTRLVLSQTISAHLAAGKTVWLNLTAGTKIMSLAALQAAFGTGIALMYVTTEKNEFIFLRSDGAEFQRIPIQVDITVQDYLEAYGLEVSDNLAFREHYEKVPMPKSGDKLEVQVETLARESGLFDDVRRSVYIRKRSTQAAVPNELDVVVTRNGRLAVVSCKATAEFDRDTLYEISSVMRREYAGIYCGKVVATTARVSDAVRDRARLWGVTLVDGPQLENISYYLKIATE